MTEETLLSDLGAQITKAGASIGRKKSDGDYGSFEKRYTLEMNVPEGADVTAIMDKIDAYLESEIERRLTLWMEESGWDPEKAQEVAEKGIAPTPEANLELVEGEAAMIVKKIKVYPHPDTAEKMFRVKGIGPKNLEYKGNWTKFGVAVYEALDQIGGFEKWKEKEFGEYDPSPGLQAVVELEGNKPVKVIRFFRET